MKRSWPPNKRERPIRTLFSSGLKGDLLSLLSGALLVLAFAPFNLSLFALLSPAWLFLAWLSLTARQAFRRGWFFGVGMFGAGVSWVFVSIHVFGHTNIPLAIFITLLFTAFLALFPALLGYLTLRLLIRFRSQDPERFVHTELLLLMPVMWVLFEWFRGWILTGFPWLHLGYSQITTALGGLAPLIGVYGVSWATAFSAGILALLFYQWPRQRISLVALLAVIWSSSWALGLAQWTYTKEAPMTVTMVQGNIDQNTKWRRGQLSHTLEHYLRLSEPHWDSDLIIWPEAAISSYYQRLQHGFIPLLAERAEKSNTDMLVGILYYDQNNNRRYNSVLSLRPEQQFYHKRHLVPFGDYLPLDSYLRGLINFFNLPMSSFSAGPDQAPLLAISNHQVGVSICYEDVFGEEVIEGLPAASLLVNISNDSWWGDTHGPHQHLQIAAMRALESGRPMLRATQNGITAYVDHLGRIQQQLPQFESGVLRVEVQPRAGATPYVSLGNAFVIFLLFSVLISGLLWQAHSRRHNAD